MAIPVDGDELHATEGKNDMFDVCHDSGSYVMSHPKKAMSNS